VVVAQSPIDAVAIGVMEAMPEKRTMYLSADGVLPTEFLQGFSPEQDWVRSLRAVQGRSIQQQMRGRIGAITCPKLSPIVCLRQFRSVADRRPAFQISRCLAIRHCIRTLVCGEITSQSLGTSVSIYCLHFHPAPTVYVSMSLPPTSPPSRPQTDPPRTISNTKMARHIARKIRRTFELRND
jgi:hypothetical protein